VIIKDYMNGTQNMGNAYYEVNNKQIFFSLITTQASQNTSTLLNNAHLGTIIEDAAYWSNTQEGLIWRTNAQTGAIQAQYLPQSLNSSDWELKNIHFEQ
jgi:hypothetical protein